MKHFPHEKLLQIHGMRLEVALNAVRDEQAIVKTHKQKCEAKQQQLATLQLERKRQQQRMTIGNGDGDSDNLAAMLLTQRELSICLYSDRLERVCNELADAQQALKKVDDALAVELAKYHRARIKRDRLREREKQWQREQVRSVARNEDQELSEFELAQCITTR